MIGHFSLSEVYALQLVSAAILKTVLDVFLL